MLQYTPFSRYDVAIQNRDIIRSDYTKNYPNPYNPHYKMFRDSVIIQQNDTHNFNPHKLVEYREHPSRYIDQTATPFFNFVNMRDTEHIDKIESKVYKQSTHGTIPNEGLDFVKY